MIDPGLVREAERTHASVIWFVGSGGIAVTALLVAIERGLSKVGP